MLNCYRDDHVTIVEANITPTKRKNFRKHKWTEIEFMDIAYDYKSIMHYAINAYSEFVSMKLQEPG